MIYSVHNPVTGLFDYFEGGADTPINDDLPTPQLKATSSIGIAAISAGRPLPAASRRAGSGALPVGSICSGKPGRWRGTAKGGIPSGLGESFVPWPDRTLKKAGMITLGTLAVVAAGCAAATDDDRMRTGWAVLSAALAAWPTVYTVRKLTPSSAPVEDNQQRFLEG